MKNQSDALYEHFQGEVLTDATLWRITRTDGHVLGFTDHDRDIIIDNVVYKASTGMTPTALDKSVDLTVGAQDIQGVLEDDRISADDLKKGLFSQAQVDICQVNWASPPATLTPGDVLWHATGFLGAVTVDDKRFKVEFRSMKQLLAQSHGFVTTKICPYDLGDANCKYNLANSKVSGIVERLVRDRSFMSASLTQETGFFSGGKVRFTSGALSGYVGEVVFYDVGTVRLYLAPPVAVEVGSSFDIWPGCDKSSASCYQKFDNAVNFGGFADIPGADAWQAGRDNGGLIDVMETQYDENERLNGPKDYGEDTTVFRTRPKPTGN